MSDDLKVENFTNSVEDLISYLVENRMNKEIHISNIRDNLGKQYVNLVQEGGGVHGIALAGFTFVLEKFGVGFLKSAGTSAGSINTLLLASVFTEKEYELLLKEKENRIQKGETYGIENAYQIPTKVKYYETRSEKVLEYLALKDLKDFVDSNHNWRTLLLRLFSFDTGKFWKSIKGSLKLFGGITSFALIMVLTAGLLIIFDLSLSALFKFFFVVLGFITMVVILITLLIRNFWLFSEKFGINKGDDFEKWVHGILVDNGIYNLTNLKGKLQLENESLSIKRDVDSDSLISTLDISHYSNDFDIENKETNKIKSKILDKLNKLNNPVNIEHEPNSQEENYLKKELAIISSDITNRIKVEFPSDHKFYFGEAYDISPSKYLRASMSVPLFFKPFTADISKDSDIKKFWLIEKGVSLNGNEFHLVDGGILSNFPIDIFFNKNQLPIVEMPTIGVKLENEFLKKATGTLQFIRGMFSTMRYFYDRDFENRNKFVKKGIKTIDVGNISWLNFGMIPSEKKELFIRGAISASIFLLKSLGIQNSSIKIKEITDIGAKCISRHANNSNAKYIDTDSYSFLWQEYQAEAYDTLFKAAKYTNQKSKRASYDSTFINSIK